MQSMLAARGYPLPVLIPKPGLNQEYAGSALITVEPGHLSIAGDAITSFRAGQRLYVFSDVILWLAVGDTEPSAWDDVQVPVSPGGVPVQLPQSGTNVYLKATVSWGNPSAVIVARF